MKKEKNIEIPESVELFARSSSYAIHFKGKDYTIVQSLDDTTNYYENLIYDEDNKVVEDEELMNYFNKHCKE